MWWKLMAHCRDEEIPMWKNARLGVALCAGPRE
jgi:hypothetical protein